MRFVKPEVFLIAKSKPDDDEIRRWLTHINCPPGTVAKYANGIGKKDGERIVELLGRRCYMSFDPGMNPNVTKIREDIADYCTNILRSRHGSVLAHVSFTFTIEGVSRVLTGELNRHAVGAAISEGSMRYIRYTDIPLVETPLLTITDEDKQDPEWQEYTNASSGENIAHLKGTAVKKQRTRELFKRMFEIDEGGYREFCEIWAEELRPESKFRDKKHVTSLGRRFIGMGVATGGGWTYNIRALRNICEQRCSEAAEEEIAVVAGKMLEIMMREEPSLFHDFHLNDSGYWTPQFSKV